MHVKAGTRELRYARLRRLLRGAGSASKTLPSFVALWPSLEVHPFMRLEPAACRGPSASPRPLAGFERKPNGMCGTPNARV